MFFPPFLILFVFLFGFLLFFLFGLVKFGLFAVAFAKLGIPPDQLFSLLFLCIVGSMVNIPVKRVQLQEEPEVLEMVSFFGLRYRVPRWRRPREMVIAVNVGGAVIPTCISLYLLAHAPHPVRMLLAVAVVTYVVHRIARPVPGLGIATPMFIPPLVAALVALVINPHWAPPTAYVAGTLGTLIGADILNLDRIKELHAPVASIGGAGTFDGVFLTGILAVLLSW
ncbi:Uncharacterized membrane protein [Desulfacinum hydrothermale DSM 13146]|uniref:Uncharacterized membrane protein n=1 Tax=Desulfacinum hydrothermale DSM 13146 TaxID=1121390 RepID=A0A1W1X118_9BACT|nr:DUF1614 domain-containing protein [Desulfacinum hydrothermale]SMC17418.1 Uncharacterized membrane protein [Desulfacinum hydrothermale DSM 13146]